MLRWRVVASLTAILIGATPGGFDAKARDHDPPGIVFDGVARTGNDTRPVRFHFFCTSNDGTNITGVLAVELEILGYDQMHALFDFDPFEGPDAHAGPLTSLRADGARSKAGDRFAAAGSVVPSGSSEAFSFELAASRREPGSLRKLAAVLRPLSDGPARLVWLQGNAKPGGTPIDASLDLAKSQSDQLKTELGPCLGAR